MSQLLKTLLGSGAKDRELTDAMRAMLEDMIQERGRFEAVVASANAAAERLAGLGEPIARIGRDTEDAAARVAELEQRLGAMVHLAGKFEALDERAGRLEEGGNNATTQVARALEEAAGIRAAFDEIRQRVDAALALKEQLGSFLDIDRPFQVLRGEADALRGQVEGTAEHLARLREQHDRLLDAHKLATTKMEALDRRGDELGRALQDKERRVSGVEQAVQGMDGVQNTVADIRRELGTLKSLADFVAQKSAALETQRDAIEDALARAGNLDRALRQIDAGVQQQQENERALDGLKDQLTALASQHESVLERSQELAQLEREAGQQAEATRQHMAEIRDEVRTAVEKFDFERQGLESVTQRVADLRGALADFEARFQGLAESSQTVAELRNRTDGLGTQVQALAEMAGSLDEDVRRVELLRRDLDELGATARELGARTTRITEAHPALEAALRDLEELGGAHARVKDSLEQTELARAEIARVREGQAETRDWLETTDQAIAALRDQVAEVRKLAPAVDVVQKQAQRVVESTSAIDARREFVDEMHRRLAELGATGGRLDERGRQLQERMDAAEQRFVALALQGEEAERISNAMAAVTADVAEAARTTEALGRTIDAAEERCAAIEELAERTRGLRDELDQRQRALEAAAKDLQRSSELRQEAAATAQQLEDTAKRLAAALAEADARVVRMEEWSTEVGDRVAGFEQVEGRLDGFEERLAKWERVEEEVSRSLEQIVTRQNTVEALRADLDRMSVTAEKTAADVRAITSAHREMAESRGLLEDVRARLRQVHDTVSSLDERRRQLIRAEERLARADALLVDVRGSLEALHGQKVIVDNAVERAGTLRILLKQAEAVIEGLREERDLNARVRTAVSLVRREDDGPAEADGAGEEERAEAA